MIKEKCNYAGKTKSDSKKLEVVIDRRIIHFSLRAKVIFLFQTYTKFHKIIKIKVDFSKNKRLNVKLNAILRGKFVHQTD